MLTDFPLLGTFVLFPLTLFMLSSNALNALKATTRAENLGCGHWASGIGHMHLIKLFICDRAIKTRPHMKADFCRPACGRILALILLAFSTSKIAFDDKDVVMRWRIR